jgi:uncharacterized SAM-binding protein YcdF (DUF218 family)
MLSFRPVTWFVNARTSISSLSGRSRRSGTILNSSWLATQIVSAVLLPPLNLALLGLFGFLLRKRMPRFAISLYAISTIALLVLCTGAGARLLIVPLQEMAPPLISARDTGAQAIIVLGGGRIPGAPEYGGRDSPTLPTLARLRYAAHLHRQTGLPLLVTGGMPDGASEAEAVVMARVLKEEFATPVKWVEGGSANTAQNALLSVQLLRPAGIGKVLLVTDPIHMARAMRAFRKTGLQPIAAPTGFVGLGPLGPLDFVPTGHALGMSHYATHEWVGMLWYRLRHGM